MTTILLKTPFYDYDDLAGAVPRWELDFLQFGKGGMSGEISLFDCPDIQLIDFTARGKRLLRGRGPDAMVCFMAMACPHPSGLRVQRQPADWNDILILPPKQDLESLTDREHCYILALKADFLSEQIEYRGLQKAWQQLKRKDVEHFPEDAVQSFRHFFQAFFSSFFRAGLRPPSLLLTEAADSLLALLASKESRLATRSPTPSLRKQRLDNLLAFITEASHEDFPTVTDLCARAEVCERTLQYAFHERFGLSPKQFLQAYRLRGVRRQLRHPDEARRKSISDIANAWDFWHLGQFAQDYHRLFGELPSQTVKKSNSPEE